MRVLTSSNSNSAVHAWVLSTSQALVLQADKERAVILVAELLPRRTEDTMVTEINRTPPFSFLSQTPHRSSDGCERRRSLLKKQKTKKKGLKTNNVPSSCPLHRLPSLPLYLIPALIVAPSTLHPDAPYLLPTSPCPLL